MRWFKHFTDNHRGRSIQFLLDEMGHAGVAGYYIIVEMCAEKLEARADGSLTKDDCVFSFHARVVGQMSRISPTNVRRLLDICQTFGLLAFEFRQNTFEISMPILLDLLHYDQKKTGNKPKRIRENFGLEKSRVEKSITEQSKVKNNQAADTIASALKFEFEKIYEQYPKRPGSRKLDGIKSLSRQIKTPEDFDLCLDAAKTYREYCEKNKTEPQFIQQFKTWCGSIEKPSWREWVKPELESRAEFLKRNGVVER